MLKACSKCGRIHDKKKQCTRKYMQANEQRNTRIVKFRNTSAWKRKRHAIKERDKYLCVYCFYGCKGKRRLNGTELSVHHIVSLEEDFEQRLEDDNLITLCRYHHELAEVGLISKEVLTQLIIDPPV